MSEQDLKWKAYGTLLKYAEPASLGFKALAEKHGITPSAVGSYFRKLKAGPNAYKDLLNRAMIPR
jgi:hypothetical protein